MCRNWYVLDSFWYRYFADLSSCVLIQLYRKEGSGMLRRAMGMLQTESVPVDEPAAT